MSATIAAIQEEIIAEFQLCAEDIELTLHHLMDQGKELPALPEEDKRDEYLIRGCQSKVWLLSEYQQGRIYYRAQSEAAITRGLVALLLRIFSGQLVEDVIDNELFFPTRIHMQRFIGTQRSGGIALTWTQMKRHALVCQQQHMSHV